jgi:hypothetical protein
MDEGQAAQAVTFEIDPDIDINSKALKDMVATELIQLPLIHHLCLRRHLPQRPRPPI